jgi:hypothetical protein
LQVSGDVVKFAKNMLLATVLASAVLSAHAQTLPKPKEFYFDEDKAATREIVVVQGEGEALVQALVRERERGRKSTEATAQLAHVAFTEGRVDLGKQLYQQLLGSSDANGNLGRAVRWNYGWDLYRNGEPQAALGQWATLLGTTGGPSWIPPTMALAMWKLDRKAEAVAWYGAAVRTEPLLWTDARNYDSLLPGWRQEDRDTLAEVLGAWQANPPRWP